VDPRPPHPLNAPDIAAHRIQFAICIFQFAITTAQSPSTRPPPSRNPARQIRRDNMCEELPVGVQPSGCSNVACAPTAHVGAQPLGCPYVANASSATSSPRCSRPASTTPCKPRNSKQHPKLPLRRTLELLNPYPQTLGKRRYLTCKSITLTNQRFALCPPEIQNHHLKSPARTSPAQLLGQSTSSPSRDCPKSPSKSQIQAELHSATNSW
jgi:hypothetical protein